MTATSKEKAPSLDEFEYSVDPRIIASATALIGVVGTILIAWILSVPLGGVMDAVATTAFYHLIPFFVSIIFFFILIYKAYVRDIKGIGFLATAVLLNGLAELLFSIDSPNGTTVFNRGSPLANLADILFPTAVVFLYLHVELIDKRRPNLVHAIGIIGTAIPIIAGGLIVIVFEFLDIPELSILTEEIRKVVLVYFGLFAIIIFWISIFGFNVMYNTLRHADSKDIALASSLVLIGFTSLITNFLILGVRYSTLLRQGNEGVIISNPHVAWLLTVALIVLILAYIIAPQFAYAVPFDVYQLLVINQMQGVTLYSFINEFRQKGELTHDALKSPAIVAIQNLVQEIAQAEGHIILIGMSDRKIILKNYKEIVSVLITQKVSYFLNKGLSDFTKDFYETYESHITNFTGNVKVFKDANKLIHQHLPFMRRDSLVAL